MTARTALWRVVATDYPPQEHTRKEIALLDLKLCLKLHPDARIQQYNQMTGDWNDMEQP